MKDQNSKEKNEEDEKIMQYRMKRAQAQGIMKELGIGAWITILADNESEKSHLPLIGAPFGASNRAYVITPKKAFAVSHDIEADIQKKYGFKTVIMKGRDVIRPLAKNLESLIGKTRVIAMNYSTRFPNADTLGYGSFKRFVSELQMENYFGEDWENWKSYFTSADELIFNVASKKLPYEIELLKQAAELTNGVIIKTFREIKPGMTEQQVAEIAHRISDKIISKNKDIGYSWPRESNPVVLTGEGIAGSPHMQPSKRVIKPGSTVYLDFGLSVKGYSGDLQQFGYVLTYKDKSNEAPERVQNMLYLLRESIQAGMAAAKPGAFGWHVDKASRDVIERAGHPTYKHGTGHQLGGEGGGAHGLGVSFSPRFDKNYNNKDLNPGEERGDLNLFSHLPLREGYVMTIEPRIQIINGASIEVDGIITKDGFELFVPIQEKVHLIC